MLAIITPSRGRPRNIAALIEALTATTVGPWRLYVGLDNDDRHLRRYDRRTDHPNVYTVVGPRESLTRWTNDLAERAVLYGGAEWLASLGDDHLPRTPAWDLKLQLAIQAMDGPGWAYGDDLLQHERIPTAWMQSADLYRTLGWMALPGCQHLCIDTAVYDLGRTAGRLAYLPQVVVEHMHPAIGKAREDATYAEGNSLQRIAEDGAAYRAWKESGLAQDAATVKELRWPSGSQTPPAAAPRPARKAGKPSAKTSSSATGTGAPGSKASPTAATRLPRARKTTQTAAQPKPQT